MRRRVARGLIAASVPLFMGAVACLIGAIWVRGTDTPARLVGTAVVLGGLCFLAFIIGTDLAE